jgi:plastocyanin
MIEQILQGLRQPEYVHVLLNPLPVYGLSVGLIGLFIAICQRSRRATIAALVIVFISSAAAWPVYHFGEQAYNGILSMTDEPGREWLAEHKGRAETLIWFFYALAILSAIALLLPINWPASSLWLATAVLVLGAISLGAGGYIAYAGGKIRHREFRNEPPPQKHRGGPAEASSAIQPSGSVAPASAHVTIQDVKYSPQTIEIKKGETIAWDNKDLTPHTVTSEGGGELNSGSIEVDASWSHTFSQTGTFSYYCDYHPEMKGTVVVK